MEENKFEGQIEDQLEGKIEFSSEVPAENLKIEPPAPVIPVPQVEYVGFWVRWIAYFIDGIVVSIIVVPINIIFAILFGSSSEPSLMALMLSSLVILTIVWSYYIFMINSYQATLGKMALGIKVVSGDLNKLPIGKIVLRETVGKIVSAIILYIGYIMAAFTNRKRALHDIMVDSVVIYKNPNKKSNTGIIIAMIIIFIFSAIILGGILVTIILVSLNSARDKASEMAVISSAKATQIGVILCADEGLKINPPANGASICNSKEGNFVWADLSGQKARWGGCQEELDLSDNEFKYCATTSSGKIITCTLEGCVIEDESSDIVSPIDEDVKFTNETDGDMMGEGGFEVALAEIVENLNEDTGAGSNIAAGFAALSQEDLSSSRQQFVWAKEKIFKSQERLSGVIPKQNEKVSYDRIEKMLAEYNNGLDVIIGGIDNKNPEEIETGVKAIEQALANATKTE